MRGARPLALALLVLAGFANTFDNGFHFDDEHSVVENPAIRQFDPVRFATDAGAFSGDPDVAMYRPLVLLTLALNHAVGDLDPTGYHVLNVLLHMGFVLLIYGLARRLSGHAEAAWWAAAVLALHPVNGQAVNYVSSRSGILAALGVVGAFWLSAAVARRRPWAAAGCQLAGLLGKSTAVVGLPLVALFAWRQRVSRRWWPVVPLAAATVVYLAAARHAGFLAASDQPPLRSLGEQLLTQAKALGYYLYLLAAPVHLSIAHPFQVAHGPAPAVVAAGLVTASLAGLALAAWQRRRLLGFGTLWFYGGLGVTSLVPLHVLVSEQRLYLSSAGLALGAAALGAAAWRRGDRSRSTARVLGAALLVLLAILTVQRNGVWQNELTLWSDAARYAADQARVQLNLGEAYYEHDQRERARRAYERALELDPESRVAWLNLGLLAENGGDAAAAERAFRQALRRRPDWPEAQASLGRLLLNQGRLQEARPLLERAVERRPSATALVNAGVAAQRAGQPRRAAEAFRRALELEPDHRDARINLAALEAEQALSLPPSPARAARLAAAAQLYEALLAARDPEASPHPAVLVNLAQLQAARGQPQEALTLLERAVAEHSDDPEAPVALAQVRLQLGRLDGAVAALEAASGPVPAGAWQETGQALARAGRLDGAVRLFERAVERAPGDVAVRYNLAEVHFARWVAARRAGDPGAARTAAAAARRAYQQVAALDAGYRLTGQRLETLAGAADRPGAP